MIGSPYCGALNLLIYARRGMRAATQNFVGKGKRKSSGPVGRALASLSA